MDRTPTTETIRRGPKRRLPEDQVHLTVRLPADDKAWLDERAGVNGTTVADLMRRLIRIARGNQPALNSIVDIPNPISASREDGAAD